jgi:cysteinyl-tRNA synthetase
MAALADLATAANTAKKPAAMAEAKADLLQAGALFGVLTQTPQAWFQYGDPAEIAVIERLVAQRNAARAAKDWPSADTVRARLSEMGVDVLDGPSGSAWRRMS